MRHRIKCLFKVESEQKLAYIFTLCVVHNVLVKAWQIAFRANTGNPPELALVYLVTNVLQNHAFDHTKTKCTSICSNRILKQIDNNTRRKKIIVTTPLTKSCLFEIYAIFLFSIKVLSSRNWCSLKIEGFKDEVWIDFRLTCLWDRVFKSYLVSNKLSPLL